MNQKLKKTRSSKTPTKALKPLGEALAEISARIPIEAWEGFPTDAAKNFDDLLEPEWVDGRPVQAAE